MKFFLILVSSSLVSGAVHVHLAPESGAGTKMAAPVPVAAPAVPPSPPNVAEQLLSSEKPVEETAPETAPIEKPKKLMLTLASAYARAQSEPLPAQGFEGSKVEHENMETSTKDWRKEYGPNSGQSTAYPAACPTVGLLLVGMLLM